MNPTLLAAVRHHQAGQLAEADRLYAEILKADPNNAHALHLRGVVAHAGGRHDEAVKLIGRAIARDGMQPDFHYNLGLALSALGRRSESVGHWERTLAINPNHAAARINLGNVLREDGRVAEAIAQHEAALRLSQTPVTHNSFGLSLASAGQHDEAMAHFSRAIAMQPAFPEPYLNLVSSLLANGRAADALGPAIHVFGLGDTPLARTLLLRVVLELPIAGDSPALRSVLIRALDESWTAPSALGPVTAALILHGPCRPLAMRATQLWPDPVPAAELLGPAGRAAANDPLLQALMLATVVSNMALEVLLTSYRAALLDNADDAWLPFCCALAQQCFINEYVYGFGDGDSARVARRRGEIEAAVASGERVDALRLAALACYVPLHELAGSDALLDGHWPPPVAALIEQQVREPRTQAALRETMPQLTAIDDDVSRAVREQYEQNPYPRWSRAAAAPPYASLNAFLREAFPSAPLQPLGKDRGLDILIAGCGTGKQSITNVSLYGGSGARTLAVDLSRASLAYAAMRSAALGSGIEYAQADIMRLGDITRRFDLIESTGVLHHMGDLWAGWRVLISLLRSGGVMRIALYSETARTGVVAARKLIAEGGYGHSADEIRRFRADLMRRDDAIAQNVMQFDDFFSLSECRDLLFHVQEHRTTIPQINAFLAAEGLRLLAVEADPAATKAYAARFPDASPHDLDCWHAFEQDHPRTFAGMYRVWMQKP